MRPSTRYARSDGLSIAYQTVGDGPLDIIYVPGWVSNLDYAWIFPPFAHVFERLSAFSRLILFDKRGTGLSDRNVGFRRWKNECGTCRLSWMLQVLAGPF